MTANAAELRERLWALRRDAAAISITRPYRRLFGEGGVRARGSVEPTRGSGVDPLEIVAASLESADAAIDDEGSIRLTARGRDYRISTHTGGLAEYESAVFTGDYGLSADGVAVLVTDSSAVFARVLRGLAAAPQPSDPLAAGIEVGTWAKDPSAWPRYVGAPEWGVHAEAWSDEAVERLGSAITGALADAGLER
ncbi:hypothetical protein ACDF64_05645 [Agromyces sp. MMS24-JH15]|uniref:hypothetical protein n=1 Tax=Agromyces sp. MMS24-JH15 TaxID=3243765 RepID=UPI003747AE3B